MRTTDPKHEVPFAIEQEIRLRRLCECYVSRVLEALQDTGERVALFQLLTSVPNDLLQQMEMSELKEAVNRKIGKTFNFDFLHPRLHDAWQGFNLVVDALVPTNDRRQMVRHWFELAIIVADARAQRLN